MARGDRRKRGKGERGPGRPPKEGPRDERGRLIPESKIAPVPERVLARRSLFAPFSIEREPQFVTNDQGDLRKIDNTHDGIGQLWLLGLLDGYPIDDKDLRDIGREWRDWFVTILRRQGFKAGGYERMDKAREREPRHNERLDRMDDALSGFERSALYSLLVDPVVGSWPLGESDAPWVRSIIGEALLIRKRLPEFVRMPDANDRALLGAAIRGLFCLYDASLPGRYERRAA